MFQIDFDVKAIGPQDIKFPKDAKEGEPQVILTIRPYPMSKSTSRFRKVEGSDDLEIVLSGAETKRIYMYCLMKWKDLVDKNGKEVKYSEENKERIFDYENIFQTGIPAFVIAKSKALEQVKEDAEKN